MKLEEQDNDCLPFFSSSTYVSKINNNNSERESRATSKQLSKQNTRKKDKI
jgi:hypothetical protein